MARTEERSDAIEGRGRKRGKMDHYFFFNTLSRSTYLPGLERQPRVSFLGFFFFRHLRILVPSSLPSEFTFVRSSYAEAVPFARSEPSFLLATLFAFSISKFRFCFSSTAVGLYVYEPFDAPIRNELYSPAYSTTIFAKPQREHRRTQSTTHEQLSLGQ